MFNAFFSYSFSFILLLHYCKKGPNKAHTHTHSCVGEDIHLRASFDERIQIFDYVGDVYVIFECGHGVSNEANAAFARGACLVPVMRSGGASSGVFNFPAGAFEKPSFATEEQWQLLSSKASPVANSAQAVVDLKWD